MWQPWNYFLPSFPSCSPCWQHTKHRYSAEIPPKKIPVPISDPPSSAVLILLFGDVWGHGGWWLDTPFGWWLAALFFENFPKISVKPNFGWIVIFQLWDFCNQLYSLLSTLYSLDNFWESTTAIFNPVEGRKWQLGARNLKRPPLLNAGQSLLPTCLRRRHPVNQLHPSQLMDQETFILPASADNACGRQHPRFKIAADRAWIVCWDVTRHPKQSHSWRRILQFGKFEENVIDSHWSYFWWFNSPSGTR